MKSSKIYITLLVTFFILPVFGQEKGDRDKDLYDFAVPAVETVKIDEKETEKKEETKKIETDASLVADAQTLIRDKLIQKYQVRLDEVIDRLASKLGTVSVDSQKTALGNLRKTMADRKMLVLDRKDLDPTKRELIVTILDHVIYRVDGLIKQSATQIDTPKSKA
jgi:hypothetical protein